MGNLTKKIMVKKKINSIYWVNKASGKAIKSKNYKSIKLGINSLTVINPKISHSNRFLHRYYLMLKNTNNATAICKFLFYKFYSFTGLNTN